MRPMERMGLTKLREAIFRELPQTGRLLEIGAGTGLNFRFYPEGVTAVASEPSAEMIKIASTKQDSGVPVRLIQARAEALPFADRSFDSVFATLVFCSVTSPQEAFAEIRRVVITGGPVVLLDHVRPAGLLGYLFDALNVLTVALFDDHFNRRMADEARKAGLEVLRVERRLLGAVQLMVCRVP